MWLVAVIDGCSRSIHIVYCGSREEEEREREGGVQWLRQGGREGGREGGRKRGREKQREGGTEREGGAGEEGGRKAEKKGGEEIKIFHGIRSKAKMRWKGWDERQK